MDITKKLGNMSLSTRTRFCNKSVCTKKGCTFAHSLEELNPKLCNFDDKCHNFDLNDPNSPCQFIHTCETIDSFKARVKVPEHILKPVENVQTTQERLMKTQMCKSRTLCQNEGCTFAHTIEELRDPVCITVDCSDSNCQYKHKTETSEEYRKRCNRLPTEEEDRLFEARLEMMKKIQPIVIDLEDDSDSDENMDEVEEKPVPEFRITPEMYLPIMRFIEQEKIIDYKITYISDVKF